MTVVNVPLFKLDANGWTAIDVQLPAGKTKNDVFSVMVDEASAYDPQSWAFATGGVDFQSPPGVARIVFKGQPNLSFTARVYVLD